jgi:hypothetical protein
MRASKAARALYWREIRLSLTRIFAKFSCAARLHNERPVNTQLFFDGRRSVRSEWGELDINLIAVHRIQAQERGLMTYVFLIALTKTGNISLR